MTASQMSAFLSYISVFFAPILVPFLVWLLGDRSAKAHATKALLSHLLPGIIVMVLNVIWAIRVAKDPQ